MSRSDPEDQKRVIERFYAAMNARDIDAILAHYAPGARLDVLAPGRFGGEQSPSREALETFYSTFPEIEFTIDAMTAEGQRVAVEVRSRGRLADGSPYANCYHNLFVVDAGRISTFREYPTGVER
jgi:ketosteroid isomerase-like protein